MKDLNPTWFGLLIAYFVPGIAGLYSTTFWFKGAQELFRTFLSTEANVGLSFFVAAAALGVGLIANGIRHVLMEFLKKGQLLDDAQFARLSQQNNLPAFRFIVEEHFRYHQFSGNIFLTSLPLFLGWLVRNAWNEFSLCANLGFILGFVLIELVNARAALYAYDRSVGRAREILKEGDGAERA